MDVHDFAAADEPGAEALVAAADGSTLISPDGLVLVWGSEVLARRPSCSTGSSTARPGARHGILHPARPVNCLIVENEPTTQRVPVRRSCAAGWEAAPGDEARGRLRVLEQPWGNVDLRVERHRVEAAALIQRREYDLVVAGPLFSLGMTGGGTDDDITAFLTQLDDVQARSGRPVTYLIVHHANVAGRVAWGRRPELLVHIQQGERRHLRVFWEKAKFSSAMHRTTTALEWADNETYMVVERELVTRERIWEDIADYVLRNGGTSWVRVREAVPGDDKTKVAVRDQMLDEGLLVDTGTTRKDGVRLFKLWHRDDPAAPQSW